MTPVALQLPLDAMALERPMPGGAERAREAGAAPADPGGEPTLDSLLSGIWEGLAAHRSAACPLCGGEIRPVYAAHARPSGGRCQSCNTSLS